MHLRNLLTWVLFALLCACASGPESDNGSVGNDATSYDAKDTSPTDTQGDALDTSTPDTFAGDTAARDIASDTEDTSLDSDGSSSSVEYDPARWADTEANCEGETQLPPSFDQEFSRPSIEPIETARTRGEILGAVGGGLQAVGVNGAKELLARNTIVSNLYANEGDDVRFHAYVYHDFTSDQLRSYRHSLTLLMDYEPVQASYFQMSDDRTEVLKEWSNVTGVAIDATRKVEIVDIEVPAEAFEKGRTYEIAIGIKSASPESVSVETFRRFPLHYGGFERGAKPCVSEATRSPLVGVESEMVQYFSSSTFAFFGQFSRGPDLRKRYEVSPGETIDAYVSLRGNGSPTEVVMVPVLNGKPLGSTWWTDQGGNTGGIPVNVDARRHIKFEMPTAFGDYDFHVFSWEDPFKMPVSLEGDKIDDISYGGENWIRGSNTLRFRVVEDNN